MLYNYTTPIIFCFCAFIVAIIITSLGDVLIEPQPDFEKNSSYECGFQPFDFNLQQFDVKYYIVALLFLIFDVEIAFIVPLVNMSHYLSINVYFNFLFFLYMLMIGFIYEGRKRYLDGE